MSQVRRKPIRATDTELKEKVVAINRVAKVVKVEDSLFLL